MSSPETCPPGCTRAQARPRTGAARSPDGAGAAGEARRGPMEARAVPDCLLQQSRALLGDFHTLGGPTLL